MYKHILWNNKLLKLKLKLNLDYSRNPVSLYYILVDIQECMIKAYNHDPFFVNFAIRLTKRQIYICEICCPIGKYEKKKWFTIPGTKSILVHRSVKSCDALPKIIIQVQGNASVSPTVLHYKTGFKQISRQFDRDL